jgi:hypothetical protein
MLPLDPVCRGRIAERGSGADEGFTPSSPISRAVRRAAESADCAASIFDERAMRRIDILFVG